MKYWTLHHFKPQISKFTRHLKSLLIFFFKFHSKLVEDLCCSINFMKFEKKTFKTIKSKLIGSNEMKFNAHHLHVCDVLLPPEIFLHFRAKCWQQIVRIHHNVDKWINCAWNGYIFIKYRTILDISICQIPNATSFHLEFYSSSQWLWIEQETSFLFDIIWPNTLWFSEFCLFIDLFICCFCFFKFV